MKSSAATFFIALASVAVQVAHAAPLDSLVGGQTGRIEFNSITPPSTWLHARRNTTDINPVVVYGDLLLPKNLS